MAAFLATRISLALCGSPKVLLLHLCAPMRGYSFRSFKSFTCVSLGPGFLLRAWDFTRHMTRYGKYVSRLLKTLSGSARARKIGWPDLAPFLSTEPTAPSRPEGRRIKTNESYLTNGCWRIFFHGLMFCLGCFTWFHLIHEDIFEGSALGSQRGRLVKQVWRTVYDSLLCFLSGRRWGKEREYIATDI